MTAENLIKGLQIIEKSRPLEMSGYHIRADHDEIWAGDLCWPMPPGDAGQLEFLGWERDENANGWRATV
jgi:hypothetical protein